MNEDDIELLLMVQGIRISEDYCHSDITIIDLANCTLAHVPKISFKDLKKHELCFLVKCTIIKRCVNRPSNTVTIRHSVICMYSTISIFVKRCFQ